MEAVLIPADIQVDQQGTLMVCHLRTGRSRTADESVGFFLMPLVVASVLPASVYGIVYLSIATVGDPAIVLASWRWMFTALAVGSWVVTTGWMWVRTPHGSRLTELKLDTDSVTLLAARGLGFHVLYRDIRDAAVVQDHVQVVQLTCEEGPVNIPLGGHTSASADWLARQLRERAEQARP